MREGLSYDQYPLILERGRSPWGGPSPAILAVDPAGQLLELAEVMSQEVVYSQDRKD